ncbi:MAG: RluA family pseudouridine synthase [Bacteroidales bacterium]|jgi:23S rRNA pseudouridine1911/1915/1917 synthase|nr:RluA family pseudouridine synthase [Bacteroidales bacterium]
MDIIYEDNHLIALNKHSGEMVQGDRTGDIPLSEQLKDFIKVRDNKPGNVFVGVIHRIDRPVSGVTVFAKTSKALGRMNLLVRERHFHKIYWAIVQNRPPKDKDTLVHYLRKNEAQNKSYVVAGNVKGALEASLSYTLAGASDRYFLLEIDLHTGRHHQIRAQLAAIGCPIRGDLKYGFPRSNTDGSISLHARQISFVHPIKKEPIIIVAPTPADRLWSAVATVVNCQLSIVNCQLG